MSVSESPAVHVTVSELASAPSGFRGYSGPGPSGDRFSYGSQGHRFPDDAAERGSAAISVSHVDGGGREHGDQLVDLSLKSPRHGAASWPSVGAAAVLLNETSPNNFIEPEHALGS